MIINPRKVMAENIRRKLEADFFLFVLWVFKNVYRRTFFVNWHHQLICRVLQDISEGKRRNVLINIPPRYSKSELCVILFIAWCILKNPFSRFLHTSYSEKLVLRNSKNVLDIFENQFVKNIWGLGIDKKEKGKQRWSTPQGGGMYSTPTGGQVTGFGAGTNAPGFTGALIIDDPNKANDAFYPNQRETVINSFTGTLMTRLEKPKETPIIVIMQRVHEGDLSGHIIANIENYEFENFCLPGIKEEHNNSYDKRKIGEPLWPGKHLACDLRKIEKRAPLVFAGQFQQRPAPLEGNIVKRNWVQYHNFSPNYKLRGTKVISCDLGFKEEGTSWVVYSTYVLHKNKVYLTDQKRGHWGYERSRDELEETLKSHSDYHICLVEDKANGPAIISELRNKYLRINAFDPRKHGSKIERLANVTPLYSAGDVFYPEPKLYPWASDHLEEVLQFPNAANDDRVDAESMALYWIDKHRQKSGFDRYYDGDGKLKQNAFN